MKKLYNEVFLCQRKTSYILRNKTEQKRITCILCFYEEIKIKPRRTVIDVSQVRSTREAF